MSHNITCSAFPTYLLLYAFLFIQPGKSQDSFDKQIVRDYLLTLDWDQTYPGPKLPDEIVETTAARYKEILGILTG